MSNKNKLHEVSCVKCSGKGYYYTRGKDVSIIGAVFDLATVGLFADDNDYEPQVKTKCNRCDGAGVVLQKLNIVE